MRHVGGDPGMQKTHGEDAAVKGLVAVEIGPSFPGMIAFSDGGCRSATRHCEFA